MNYLLDTCILSTARKKIPGNQKLHRWLDDRLEVHCFISALTLGEIQAGISKLRLAEQRKKTVFEKWLLEELIPRFSGRILEVDMQTCLIWGKLRGESGKKGTPLPLIDSMIAALAIQHQMTLVTLNTKDFAATGASLLNPLA